MQEKISVLEDRISSEEDILNFLREVDKRKSLDIQTLTDFARKLSFSFMKKLALNPSLKEEYDLKYVIYLFYNQKDLVDILEKNNELSLWEEELYTFFKNKKIEVIEKAIENDTFVFFLYDRFLLKLLSSLPLENKRKLIEKKDLSIKALVYLLGTMPFPYIKKYIEKKEIYNRLSVGTLEQILSFIQDASKEELFSFYTSPLILNKISVPFFLSKTQAFQGKKVPKEVLERMDSLSLKTLVKDYNLNDISIFLKESSFPFEKAVFFLELQAEIPKEERKLVLKKIYPQEMKKYLFATFDQIVLLTKKQIYQKLIQKKEIENFSLFVRDLMICPFFQEKKEEILQVYFSDDALFEKKPKELFLFLLSLVIEEEMTKKGIPFSYDFVLLSEYICGEYYESTEERPEEILLSTDSLSDNLFDNLFVFNTFYHELEHLNQDRKKLLDEPDYQTLKQVLDNLLRSKITTYYNAYGEGNYERTSFESGARCKAYIKTYELLKKYNPKQAKVWYQGTKNHFVNDYQDYKTVNRFDKKEEVSLFECFEKYFSVYDRMDLRRTYPVLCYLYDEKGVRFSKEKILKKIEQLKIDSTEEKKKELLFYKKYCKDLKKDEKIIEAYDSAYSDFDFVMVMKKY